jgi:hypothetical protein
MGAASFFFLNPSRFKNVGFKKKIQRTAGIATKKTIFAAKFNNKNT